MRLQHLLELVQRAGRAQVEADRQPLRLLPADLGVVPAALGAQGEAAAEFVLAQVAFDHEDAVARQ